MKTAAELPLPPPGVPRYGPGDDDGYVAGAMRSVRYVARHTRLNAESRVLDLGCGAGRFLTGLVATFGHIRSYVGLDVRNRVVAWASQALARPDWGDIRFELLDVENARYNAGGRTEGSVDLPVESESIDVTVLLSVFSHMTLETTRDNLLEIGRTLDHGGQCYLTAFVEDGVPPWTENPEGYGINARGGRGTWKRPLHCTRFNRATFDGLVDEAVLTIEHFTHKPEQQSTYVLLKS